MTNLDATTEIAIELINGRVSSIETILNDKDLYSKVKYNGKQLNISLKNDFDQFTEILQSVVDSFYYNNYVVDTFLPLYPNDLDFCKEHNLSVLNSMKKVLKFIK